MRTFAALMALALLAAPAQAQMLCGTRAALVAELAAKHQEQRKGSGLASGQMKVEVFASQAGNFTMILTGPNGLSCVLLVGDSWQDVAVAPEGQPT